MAPRVNAARSVRRLAGRVAGLTSRCRSRRTAAAGRAAAPAEIGDGVRRGLAALDAGAGRGQHAGAVGRRRRGARAGAADPDRQPAAAGQGGRHPGQAEAGRAAARTRPVRRRPGPRRRPGRAQQRAGPADERTASRAEPALADGGGVPGRAHHRPRATAGAQGSRRGPVEDIPADLRATVAEGGLAAQVRDASPTQGVDCPPCIVGQPVRTAGRDLEFYLLFPLTAEQRTLGPRAEHADRRRAGPAAAAGRHREPGHPAGRAPGPAGRRDRRAVRRRPPRRADARARRRRGGPARRVVQRDGEQHPDADPPARGVRRAAAPVHLRRQPRAAHAADHRADGRRRPHASRDELLPALRRSSRAAGRRAGPVRGAARRPAGDQPARRRGGRPGRGAGRHARRGGRAPSRRCAGSPTRPAPRWSWTGRPRSTPRSTRAGSSGSCATSWPTRSTTARAGRCDITLAGDERRGRGAGPRPRRRAAAGRGGAGVQPVLAGRGVAGPAQRWQRPRAVDQPRGRPPARRLAAGVGRDRRRARRSG